ncbi:Kazal-type serine proteinase inhibitor 1 [Apostichopus japonicus]|uniref:Kazal-type serine proteinase inhibitor 1 n=1 Tax=Stichopus japonicus TaxID=307972 RepID=A0A2G8KK52_STIJA|nr:Kazal-type serine proteinase inhibitor 1 [Apostichopus japonicus]
MVNNTTCVSISSGNACDNNDCINGDCTETDFTASGYTCTCFRGYVGEYCDIPVDNQCDECINGDCLLDPFGGRGSTCIVLFVGTLERTVTLPIADLCGARPCENRGFCFNERCFCLTGYEGEFCEIVGGECANDPCQNDGDCTNIGESGYVCLCKRGYFGTNCEESLCDLSVCQNGGRCQLFDASTFGYVCHCLNGYIGQFCELIGECDTACIAVLDPVCGTDGTTYGNDCELGIATCRNPTVTLAARGPCPDECDTFCFLNYDPVCGTDGVTYSNDCELGIATCRDPRVALAYRGECTNECDTVCFTIYDPVCGTDGVTYSNDCELGIATCRDPRVALAYRGECTNECDTFCIFIYDPVCGTDGVTYGNDCELGTATCKDSRVTLAYRGECTSECDTACIAVFDPVCGTDGTTYGNDCELGIATCRNPMVTLASRGPCPDECDTFCILIYDPVCGTDGVTYSNDCALGVATCKDPRVTLAYSGECTNECDTFCIFIYDPVCGTDGVTYGNDCELGIATCKDSRVTLAYSGECTNTDCVFLCAAIYAPVCGSDGQTYSNACELRGAACLNPEIFLLYEGECDATGCDFACEEIYAPVCGSDGQTYSNGCELRRALCFNPTISLLHHGECDVTGCNFPCVEIYAPVCGSDGQTYGNACELRRAACLDPNIYEQYEGECVEQPPVCMDCAASTVFCNITHFFESCDNCPNISHTCCDNCCGGQRCLPRDTGPNACSSRPCYNGGTCVSQGPFFECRCPPGYTGLYCEQVFEEECQDCRLVRVDCTAGIMNQRCGYCPNVTHVCCEDCCGGQTCVPRETGTNMCDYSPCQNGGSCFPRGGDYMCLCPVGIGGRNCEDNGPDTTPPFIFNCSAVHSFVFDSGASVPVEWSPPTGFDDRGGNVVMTGPGLTSLSLPAGSWNFYYTFQDVVGNLAQCFVNVVIEALDCDNLDCSDTGGPVCGSNFETYSDICELRRFACSAVSEPPSLLFDGSCEDFDPCAIDCPDITRPVCSTDGYTYPNLCELSIDRCRYGDIEIAHEGGCENACDGRPCMNGGSCRPLGLEDFFCMCPLDFLGPICDVFVGGGGGLCNPNPCMNGGTCEELPFLDLYICQCPNGLFGLQCQDGGGGPCDPNPCGNGGTCESIPFIDVHICTCPDGSIGQNCASGGVCDQNPCGTGGTCQETPIGHICICQDGSIGPECPDGIGCDRNPCGTGGTCQETPIGHICFCPDGNIGPECIGGGGGGGACDPNPCGPRGTCQETPIGHICFCPDGSIGPECLGGGGGGACDPNPCGPRGTCEETPFGYICFCPDGSIGQECPDGGGGGACDPNPCFNDGSCSELPFPDGAYICSCLPGTFGVNCENGGGGGACDPNPCGPRGTCEETPFGYICFCPDGSIGQECPDGGGGGACDPNPCFNDGSCSELPFPDGAYICNCLPGTFGVNCENGGGGGACDPNPCGPRGTCEETPFGYICFCPDGSIGQECPDGGGGGACDPNPCGPRGTCQETPIGHICFCPDGSIGPECPDGGGDRSCDSNPCQNGGTCEEFTFLDGYYCNCPPGVLGLDCEIAKVFSEAQPAASSSFLSVVEELPSPEVCGIEGNRVTQSDNAMQNKEEEAELVIQILVVPEELVKKLPLDIFVFVQMAASVKNVQMEEEAELVIQILVVPEELVKKLPLDIFVFVQMAASVKNVQMEEEAELVIQILVVPEELVKKLPLDIFVFVQMAASVKNVQMVEEAELVIQILVSMMDLFGTSFSDGVYLYCLPGTFGVNCENGGGGGACDPNPCFNDGSCSELPFPDGAYICSCLPGTFGVNCENGGGGGACDPNPCGPRGTCEETPFGYICFVQMAASVKNVQMEEEAELVIQILVVPEELVKKLPLDIFVFVQMAASVKNVQMEEEAELVIQILVVPEELVKKLPLDIFVFVQMAASVKNVQMNIEIFALSGFVCVGGGGGACDPNPCGPEELVKKLPLDIFVFVQMAASVKNVQMEEEAELVNPNPCGPRGTCEETPFGYICFLSRWQHRSRMSRWYLLAYGTCPDGTGPVTTCFDRPCGVGRSPCTSYPDAVCVDNYCGGCNTDWYLDGELVDCNDNTACPDGLPPIPCLVDPCTFASCTSNPEARCVANYCNRMRPCLAEWFDENGDQVECGGGGGACDPNPCGPRGTCEETPFGYICFCPDVAGQECPDDIAPCASNPCLNGGTCTPGDVAFFCTCVQGFTGRNCQDFVGVGVSIDCPTPGAIEIFEIGANIVAVWPLVTCSDGINFPVAATCSSDPGDVFPRGGNNMVSCLCSINMVVAECSFVVGNDAVGVFNSSVDNAWCLPIIRSPVRVTPRLISLQKLTLSEWRTLCAHNGWGFCLPVHLASLVPPVNKNTHKQDMFSSKDATPTNKILSTSFGPINPCVSQPCLNGGVCSPSPMNPADFTCACPAANTGRFCQDVVPPLVATCLPEDLSIITFDTGVFATWNNVVCTSPGSMLPLAVTCDQESPASFLGAGRNVVECTCEDMATG